MSRNLEDQPLPLCSRYIKTVITEMRSFIALRRRRGVEGLARTENWGRAGILELVDKKRKSRFLSHSSWLLRVFRFRATILRLSFDISVFCPLPRSSSRESTECLSEHPRFPFISFPSSPPFSILLQFSLSLCVLPSPLPSLPVSPSPSEAFRVPAALFKLNCRYLSNDEINKLLTFL